MIQTLRVAQALKCIENAQNTVKVLSIGMIAHKDCVSETIENAANISVKPVEELNIVCSKAIHHTILKI